ncbi:MAG: uroporphyrinogen-III C-methyltransferase [Xanthomonadales bacterium]|nr:uroporphyrinogen-III C-methyltransferase [Xanthomonadales bacterium]
MSDTPPRPETSPAPAKRGRGLLWFALVLLAAAGGGAGYVHYELQRVRGAAVDAEAWRLEAEALNARLSALDRQLAQYDGGRRSLDERTAELASNQRVIRQELLGMGERAATIEDAVARLSDQRLRGEIALKLNEIEGLLVLADQRLLLARDRAGARTALQLALSALDTIEDPLYAGLALPLRAELAQLDALPADPLPGLRATLANALSALPGLPRAPLQEARGAASAGMGRLQQALSGLVTVRRTDEAAAVLTGSAREAALEALQLDLRVALLAAEARDADALSAALSRAQSAFARLFDADDARVRGLSEALAALKPADLAAPLPTLGASLAELRALRGSRPRLPEASDPPSPAIEAPPAAADPVEPEPALLLELEPETEGEPGSRA